MYSGFWPSARLKCVLRGTSCPSLELPRPAEVAHSRRSCEGGLFSLLNGCFCFRGVCAGGRFPLLLPPLLLLLLLSPSHSLFFSFSFPPNPASHSPLSQPLAVGHQTHSPSSGGCTTFKPSPAQPTRGGGAGEEEVCLYSSYKVMSQGDIFLFVSLQ